MMANWELELDKKNNQSLQKTIHLKFGSQNDSGPSKSQTNLVIPQLMIPQLNTSKGNTAQALAAQEEHRRLADAHNEMLFNAIKQRREQNNNQMNDDKSSDNSSDTPFFSGIADGFTIPKLRTANGEPLEEPQFNIPLLNKLRNQNNSLELSQLQQAVNQLHIVTDNGGDSAKLKTIQVQSKIPSMDTLIDLTSTVIAIPKDAPPRESASKMRHMQAQAAVDHFDIPFISCDSLRGRMSVKMSRRRENSTSSDNDTTDFQSADDPSDVGRMLDDAVGYPEPRQPHLKYAATTLELQHLKLIKREDYACNIERFRFDTPSPDEMVKQALQKSWRISRT